MGRADERSPRIRLLRTDAKRKFEVCLAGTGPDTLLAIPGGPGCSFDYLSPILRLANNGLRVLLMNPRGVGRSWSPQSTGAFTIHNSARDVELVRKSVAVDRLHLLGYSAGGMVAIEYARLYPSRLASLILCSTAASVAEVSRGYQRVLADASPLQRRRLRDFESAKDFESPAYRRLVAEINRPYTTRFSSPCCDLLRGLPASPVYRAMCTPSGDEYRIDGAMEGWNRTRDLGRIRVPTLILTGRYDFLRGASERIAARVPGAHLRVMTRSSHMSVQEQPDEFVSAVRTFLCGTPESEVPIAVAP